MILVAVQVEYNNMSNQTQKTITSVTKSEIEQKKFKELLASQN